MGSERYRIAGAYQPGVSLFSHLRLIWANSVQLTLE